MFHDLWFCTIKHLEMTHATTNDHGMLTTLPPALTQTTIAFRYSYSLVHIGTFRSKQTGEEKQTMLSKPNHSGTIIKSNYISESFMTRACHLYFRIWLNTTPSG